MIGSQPQPTAAGAARQRVTVAFAGRPNSGKTSLLMHVTGSPQRPVNFPGTSVERSEGSVDVGGIELRAVDLPGIGSLAPITRDEAVTVDYLAGDGDADPPDVLCAVVDASKLSVELALLRALCGLGRPVVVALNKQDVAARRGQRVDAAALQRLLGLAVVETRGRTGLGTDRLVRELLAAAAAPPRLPIDFDPDALAARVQPPATAIRTRTQRIDAVVLHPWLGLPVLGLLVLATFQLVFSGAAPFMDLLDAGQASLAAGIESLLPDGALRSLVVDGIVSGVGSILSFLPQIALLVALIAVLEASGYMARAAFLLDGVLGRIGLSGRSVLPLAGSFACAIPGILSTRILDDERDRIATIVVAPLMSCSARLPIYVLLIGAFFPPAAAGVVLFGMYSVGIVAAAVVALILRRTVLRGGRALMLLELPSYQLPSPRVIGAQVWAACREFILLAGTVILVTSIVVWGLSYYPRPQSIHDRFAAQRTAAAAVADGDARRSALARVDASEQAAYLEQSLLARLGKGVQPLFAPAGFDWRTTVGVVAAFPARELIIPTLGILHGLGEIDAGDYAVANLTADDGVGLRQRLRQAKDADGRRLFDALTALAVMVFFALCSQCMATLGAIRRETRSWRWPVFTFAYMTGLAWVGAVVVYQVGSALGLGSR